MTPTQKIELTIRAAIAAHAILDMCKTVDFDEGDLIIKLKMRNAANEFIELDKFIKEATR